MNNDDFFNTPQFWAGMWIGMGISGIIFVTVVLLTFAH